MRSRRFRAAERLPGKTEGFSLSDELEFEQLPRDVKGLLLEVDEEINTVWKNFPRMVSMYERSCLNILPGSWEPCYY